MAVSTYIYMVPSIGFQTFFVQAFKRKTSWQQGDDRTDQFRSHSSWCSGDVRWKLDLLLWPRDQDQDTEFPVEACWLSQTQEGQIEQIHPQTFDDPFFWQHWHDLHALGSHWTYNQQGILCWGFKGVQIGSVAFPPGKCTSPQLHPCHRLFDQDGHQDSSLPSLVQVLLPVTFGYSLSSRKNLEAIVMRQLRWKRLWWRSLTCSHKRTSMGLPEVVGMVQQCIAAGGDYIEGD